MMKRNLTKSNNEFIISDFVMMFYFFSLRKPSLSQKLTELAQRVDFSSKVGDDTSEPAAKKAVQRWPWELANSKLK